MPQVGPSGVRPLHLLGSSVSSSVGWGQPYWFCCHLVPTNGLECGKRALKCGVTVGEGPAGVWEAQGPLVCLHGQSHMILDNEGFLSQVQLLHL